MPNVWAERKIVFLQFSIITPALYLSEAYDRQNLLVPLISNSSSSSENSPIRPDLLPGE